LQAPPVRWRKTRGAVQQAISRFWNGFNWEEFAQVYHPDYRDHAPGNPLGNFESTKSGAEAVATGFPDLCTIIHDFVAEGDKVVKRWQCTWTHQGPYFGAAPTGRAGLVQGINVYRVAGGKVAEIWWGQDTLGMLRTIGLLPS
jgi:predicted ester cyclase